MTSTGVVGAVAALSHARPCRARAWRCGTAVAHAGAAVPRNFRLLEELEKVARRARAPCVPSRLWRCADRQAPTG